MVERNIRNYRSNLKIYQYLIAQLLRNTKSLYYHVTRKSSGLSINKCWGGGFVSSIACAAKKSTTEYIYLLELAHYNPSYGNKLVHSVTTSRLGMGNTDEIVWVRY